MESQAPSLCKDPMWISMKMGTSKVLLSRHTFIPMIPKPESPVFKGLMKVCATKGWPSSAKWPCLYLASFPRFPQLSTGPYQSITAKFWGNLTRLNGYCWLLEQTVDILRCINSQDTLWPPAAFSIFTFYPMLPAKP